MKILRNFLFFSTKDYLMRSSVITSFLYLTRNRINFFLTFGRFASFYYPYHWLSLLFDLKKFNQGLVVSRNYFTMVLKNEYNLLFATTLKQLQVFSIRSLMDICVTDYPQRNVRFEMLYCYLSLHNNLRVFSKFFVSELDFVQSLCQVFRSANWLEREAWDLFGVFFSNHPNLRRILTDYGFKGFPFRRDFPLTGYVEVRYDDESSSVVYEPLEVSQEFRSFNFRSPWEEFIV